MITMTALFEDGRQRLDTPKQLQPIRGIKFAESLFADDTLILGTHTHSMNKYLEEIQIESAYYNRRRNLDKCIILTLNQKRNVFKYMDGTKVARNNQATYLGIILRDSHNKI